MIVYKTTNLINGKIYVGQDKYNNPNYLGSGKILSKAIKKYGINNFEKITLETCMTKEELDEKEKYWIKELNSVNPNIGYNISNGGHGGDLGPEWRKLVSAGVGIGIDNHNYGKTNLGRKGKPAWNAGLTKDTDVRVLKYSSKRKGVQMSESQKQKLRKPKSDFGRENIKRAAKLAASIKLKCPICGVECTRSNARKWHFDNCGKAYELTCPHCGKIGSQGPGMYKFHFNNCKFKI